MRRDLAPPAGRKVMQRIYAVAFVAVIFGGTAYAQQQAAPSGMMNEDEYIRQATSAAPPSVAKDASVMRMHKGSGMRTVRKGTNEFTCMIVDEGRPNAAPMCADPNAMEWAGALTTKAA